MRYRIKECKELNPVFYSESNWRPEIEDSMYAITYYVVQMKLLCFWIGVKHFFDKDDTDYARRCAEELLEKLEEKI